MVAEMSLPTTRPVSSSAALWPLTSGATRLAARAVVTPDPQPTSSTASPGRSSARSNNASETGSS